jgi:hypothetical protein
MKASERFGTLISLLVMSLSAIGCSKKGPECQALIGSMNELGSQLAETQKVIGNGDAKPERAAAALRPFAVVAKSTGDRLAKGEMTVPEIKKIAADASAAALALAASATSMAGMADRMKGLDAAGKAVEDQRKVIDGAEAAIKKICEANAAQCTELAQVLARFPSPPEKSDNLQATAAWNAKLTAWTNDLGKVQIKNRALDGHVTALDKGWKAFAAAMTTLANMTAAAKQYDDLAKAFNAQIEAARKAVGEANGFCKS